MRGFRVLRIPLAAAAIGSLTGLLSAALHDPQPVGSGFLIFGGILIGAQMARL